MGTSYTVIKGPLKRLRLRPASFARVLPEYVPSPVREDYLEACAILEQSPKAAATLCRRALQGMIRDFWKVRKATLAKEIDAIKDSVDPLTWKAIEAVRKVGNIGAHMEKDIDLIVDIEAGEAVQLKGLIEILVQDWYVAKHRRETALAEIVAVAEKKEQERAGLHAENGGGGTPEVATSEGTEG